MSSGPARRHGVWQRRRSSPAIAIDLGSARTRIWISGAGLVADTPTVSSTRAGVSHPVRRGSIVDLGGAMHLLERLLHGRSDLAARPGVVVLTVPALCTPADRTIAITAAEALEPRTVLTIDSVKAAAIGAKADFDRPLLVVDLGAHLTEVALLYDGAVVAASCAALGTNDLAADITTGDLVVSVLDMVTGLLHSDCAPQVVDALDAGPVLAGGGSLLPAIVYQLAKRLSSPVRPAPMPHTAAIRGAGQVTQSANRHPST